VESARPLQSPPELGHQGFEHGGCLTESGLEPRHGPAKPLDRQRLQEEIDRALVEGRDRVLVVGGGLSLASGMTLGPDGDLYVPNLGFGPPPVGLGQILKVQLRHERHHRDHDDDEQDDRPGAAFQDTGAAFDRCNASPPNARAQPSAAGQAAWGELGSS